MNAISMRFENQGRMANWSTLAHDFVLNLGSDGPKVKQFLKVMKQAKLEMERKMREQLDQ